MASESMPEMDTGGFVTGSAEAASNCCGAPIDWSDDRSAPSVSVGSVLRIGVSILLTVNSFSLALSFNTSELTPSERGYLATALIVATLIVVLLLGAGLFKGLLASVLRRRLTVESLFALGIVGASGYSLGSLYRGSGPLYFEVVNILLVVYALGNLLRGHVRASATQAVKQWSPREMTCHFVSGGGGLETRLVSEIVADDHVRVFPGEVVPVDGRIVAGQALVRQANLTGEPFLVSKGTGDVVQAAVHCIDGTITLESTTDGTARYIDGVMDAVATWTDEDSRFSRSVSKFVGWFFWVVAASSVATLLYWGWGRSNWEAGILNSLAVLLVACPCAIGFATPIGVWAGLVRFASYRFYFKDPMSAIGLGDIDHVVVDKTGTLTAFEPELKRFDVLGNAAWGRDDLLAVVTAIQEVSEHPIARAFQGSASGPRSETAIDVKAVRNLPGRGIAATVKLGSSNSVCAVPQWGDVSGPAGDQLTCSPSVRSGLIEVELTRAPAASSPLHQIHVLVNGDLVGLAEFEERPLEGIVELQADLARMGIRLTLLSGDLQCRVDRLGFSDAVGGMSPHDKLRFVEQASREGSVLFVGDGLNDAPAMSVSSLSIAVHIGAPVALEVADIVWGGAQLTDLVRAIEIGRLIARTIRRNILFSASYNTIGLLLAASGWLHPVVAAVLMMASSLSVTILSARLLDTELDPLSAKGRAHAATPDLEPRPRVAAPPGLDDQRSSFGERTPTLRRVIGGGSTGILGAAPWVVIALSPKCPLCWAAYLSAFGLSSLQGLAGLPSLLGASAAFALVYVGVVARRCWLAKNAWPLALSLAGMGLLGASAWGGGGWPLRVAGMLLLFGGSGLSASLRVRPAL